MWELTLFSSDLKSKISTCECYDIGMPWILLKNKNAYNLSHI